MGLGIVQAYRAPWIVVPNANVRESLSPPEVRSRCHVATKWPVATRPRQRRYSNQVNSSGRAPARGAGGVGALVFQSRERYAAAATFPAGSVPTSRSAASACGMRLGVSGTRR